MYFSILKESVKWYGNAVFFAQQTKLFWETWHAQVCVVHNRGTNVATQCVATYSEQISILCSIHFSLVNFRCWLDCKALNPIRSAVWPICKLRWIKLFRRWRWMSSATSMMTPMGRKRSPNCSECRNRNWRRTFSRRIPEMSWNLNWSNEPCTSFKVPTDFFTEFLVLNNRMNDHWYEQKPSAFGSSRTSATAARKVRCRNSVSWCLIRTQVAEIYTNAVTRSWISWFNCQSITAWVPDWQEQGMINSYLLKSYSKSIRKEYKQ